MKTLELGQGRLIGLIALGALLGSVAGSVGLSFADNLATTSSVLDGGVVIPYDGYLMLDSSPVNATGQTLKFALFESPSGGTAQWVENHVVNVNNGKFSVALGQGTKLSSVPANATFNEVVLDAEKLYIAISVIDANGTITDLAGRQAIEAAPFAAWAATSSDFRVERDLLVRRNAQVDGALNVTGQVSSDQGVTASKFDGAYIPRYQNWASQGVGAGGAGIYNDSSTTYGALMLVGNRSLGGDRRLELFDDLEVADDLFVTDYLEVGGNTNIKGTDLLLGTTNTVRGDGGRALVKYSSDQLYINFSNDFSGGTRVDSNLRVNDNLRVDGTTQLVGNVTVDGTLSGGFRYTSEYTQSSNGDQTMIATSAGLCFLTSVYWDHAWDDIYPMGCRILSSGGNWILRNTEATGAAHPIRGDVSCRARCLVGPTPQ